MSKKFEVQDYYFKKAKKENFLARSIYKLEEIDSKHKIINQGDNVLDLGYHPGSWIQYISQKIGKTGFVTGIDIKPINKKLASLKNVKLFEKDIGTVSSMKDLELDAQVDVLVSDMAPNTTGIKSVDQARSLNLIEDIFKFLPLALKIGGNLVFKGFASNDLDIFINERKLHFNKTSIMRPKSTRSISKEIFVIMLGYKG
jgi:23S rRNA (uridine2552-2'-O)-methyltransferase